MPTKKFMTYVIMKKWANISLLLFVDIENFASSTRWISNEVFSITLSNQIFCVIFISHFRRHLLILTFCSILSCRLIYKGCSIRFVNESLARWQNQSQQQKQNKAEKWWRLLHFKWIWEITQWQYVCNDFGWLEAS